MNTTLTTTKKTPEKRLFDKKPGEGKQYVDYIIDFIDNAAGAEESTAKLEKTVDQHSEELVTLSKKELEAMWRATHALAIMAKLNGGYMSSDGGIVRNATADEIEARKVLSGEVKIAGYEIPQKKESKPVMSWNRQWKNGAPYTPGYSDSSETVRRHVEPGRRVAVYAMSKPVIIGVKQAH